MSLQTQYQFGLLKLSTCVMNKEREQWNTVACVCDKWADLRNSSFLTNTLEMRCLWNSLLKILLYFVLKIFVWRFGTVLVMLRANISFNYANGEEMNKHWLRMRMGILCYIRHTGDTLCCWNNYCCHICIAKAQMGKIEKALIRGFSCLLTVWLQTSVTLKYSLYS